MSSDIDPTTGSPKIALDKGAWRRVKNYYIYTEKEMEKHYILEENTPFDNGRRQNN